jgi:hypothetical protein
MNDTQKTCLLKFVLYFGIGICVTKAEFQQLFAVLAMIEVFASTNPWLTKS